MTFGYNKQTKVLFDSAFNYKKPEELGAPYVMGHDGKPPGQGPFIEIYLTFDKEKILDATFKTYGCPACIACSKAVCILVTEKTFAQAAQIRASALIELVGELPRTKKHCIEFALGALTDALKKIESI